MGFDAGKQTWCTCRHIKVVPSILLYKEIKMQMDMDVYRPLIY